MVAKLQHQPPSRHESVASNMKTYLRPSQNGGHSSVGVTPPPLRRRRNGAQRIEHGDSWPSEYDQPGPCGRAETCLHLQSAGLCPGYTVAELREAWHEASEDERESIVITVKAVAA